MLTEFEKHWNINLDTVSLEELKSISLLMYDWVKLHQESVNRVNKQKENIRELVKSMEKILNSGSR